MKINSLFFTLAIAICSLCLTACNFNGGVDQGRCVAFNSEAKNVTLVVDTSLDQHNPHYSGEVITFKLPINPIDMGPEPVPGGLLQVEQDKNQILVYDSQTKSIKQIPVEFTEIIKEVGAKNARLKGKTFPIINNDTGTIQVYSRRLEELATFKVAPEYLQLPPETWKSGDEVRIAFRNDDKNQAIRLMNVSKTSIFTR